jgi:hypothetical protein
MGGLLVRLATPAGKKTSCTTNSHEDLIQLVLLVGLCVGWAGRV